MLVSSSVCVLEALDGMWAQYHSLLSISTGSFQSSQQVISHIVRYFSCTMFYGITCSYILQYQSLYTHPSFQSPPLLPLLSSLSSPTSSPAGVSATSVLLYSVGFIFAVVVFPIGLIMWMLSCGRVFSDGSEVYSQKCFCSPHNSTSECAHSMYTVFIYLRAGIFHNQLTSQNLLFDLFKKILS